MSERELREVKKGAIEVFPNRFFFIVARRPEALKVLARHGVVLYVDSELVYESFYADFGPLNAGCTYHFCEKANAAVQEAAARKVPVYFMTSNHAHKKANAAVLLGTWLVVYHGWSAARAWTLLQAAGPFTPFRDASCGHSQFDLTVSHCLMGVERAREEGFIDWHLPTSQFSVEKYDHYEQVIHGDWNWILPNKFIAVSGPTCVRRAPSAYSTLGCEDYSTIFKQEGVTAVVRLNKAQYDKRHFTKSGLKHYDLYFPDGTCPPDHILQAFLEISESEPGALAVHCKAGLGRTGTLICCYIMKHYGFTAEEVLGYIRICRPGSILGPQQLYLKDRQMQMWGMGGIRRSISTVAPRHGSTITLSGLQISEQQGLFLDIKSEGNHLSRQDSEAMPASLGTAHEPAGALDSGMPQEVSSNSLAASQRSHKVGRSSALSRMESLPPSSRSVDGWQVDAPAASGSHVVRMLAPNGQPRKVVQAPTGEPSARLGAYRG